MPPTKADLRRAARDPLEALQAAPAARGASLAKDGAEEASELLWRRQWWLLLLLLQLQRLLLLQELCKL